MTAALPAASPDLARLYDRLAPDYDRLHRRWLRLAGGEAQAALEAAVRVLARPGARLLDAGCGTGRFARALLAEGMAPEAVTLCDPAPAMLACAADLPVACVAGRLEALPFTEASFDIVTCAWAIETTPDPALALAELARVVRPGGALCLAFCADRPPRDLGDRAMRAMLTLRGTGTFLSPARVAAALPDSYALRWLPCAGPVAALLARRRA